MKYILILLFMFGVAHAQLTYYIRSDSVKIEKTGGNNELFIKNATRGVNGILTNVGGGKTAFIGSRFVGDTLFIGRDTLTGIGSGSAGWSLTGNTGSGNFLGTTDAQALVIKTNNAERLRILSAGNVGINTTTPAYTLDVAGSFGVTTMSFTATTKDTIVYWDPSTRQLGRRLSGAGSNLYLHSVVKSGDSVRLKGETLTVQDSSVYGKIGTQGHQPAAVINTGSGTIGQVVTWAGGRLFQLADASPPFFYIPFKPGLTPSAPTPGDSTLQQDALIGKSVRVFRDGHIQYPNDTLQGFTFDNTTGILTVHPPWALGEEVQLDVYGAALDSVSLITPPSWEDLSFTTNTGLVNTSQVFTGSVTTGWNNFGVDALQLTGDGSYRTQYVASDGDDYVMGFDNSGTPTDWTNYSYGVYRGAGGDCWPVVAGSLLASVHSISVGDYVMLNRTGSTFTIQTSTDGTTWTVRYTFAATSSATFYTALNIFNDTSTIGKVYYPQGFNLH